MPNRLLTPAEFVAEVMDAAKKCSTGDPKLELILVASMGAAMNGPDSPAADLLQRLLDDEIEELRDSPSGRDR